MLLSLKDEGQQEMLFQTARSVRDNYFGTKIFFYGFIYLFRDGLFDG
jgi:biotin synthase-like enzyme